MANIRFSAIVSDAAGSIGGVTLSRGKGGAVAHTRRKGVNPRSATQITMRALTAYIANYWSGTLTAQQRLDWEAYAAGTSWTNKLGDSISISGNAAFMRLNGVRSAEGEAILAAAPTAMGHAGGVTMSFDAYNDTSLIHLADPGGSFDKDVSGQRLYIYQGLPSEAGRTSIPKGMRYIGHAYGSLAAPIVFPLDIASAYTMAAGQLITIKAMFLDEFSRVSGPFFATATAAPSI